MFPVVNCSSTVKAEREIGTQEKNSFLYVKDASEADMVCSSTDLFMTQSLLGSLVCLLLEVPFSGMTPALTLSFG